MLNLSLGLSLGSLATQRRGGWSPLSLGVKLLAWWDAGCGRTLAGSASYGGPWNMDRMTPFNPPAEIKALRDEGVLRDFAVLPEHARPANLEPAPALGLHLAIEDSNLRSQTSHPDLVLVLVRSASQPDRPGPEMANPHLG